MEDGCQGNQRTKGREWERETGPIETQATTSTKEHQFGHQLVQGGSQGARSMGSGTIQPYLFLVMVALEPALMSGKLMQAGPDLSYDDDRRLDFHADSSDGGRLWYLFHFWHLSHRRAFSFWDHEAPCSNTLCDFRDWGYPEIFPQTENHCGKVPSWPDLAPVPPNIEQQAVMLCSAGDGISSRS